MEFEKLPLHDATLKDAVYDWGSMEAVFSGALVSRKPMQFVLKFNGVSFLSIPHHNDWGQSLSINQLSGSKPDFSIHMQSGDIIRVNANGFTFDTEST